MEISFQDFEQVYYPIHAAPIKQSSDNHSNNKDITQLELIDQPLSHKNAFKLGYRAIHKMEGEINRVTSPSLCKFMIFHFL